MGLHYFIDGYNLLYALPEIPKGPWPEKRDILLHLLETSQPQGRNLLTVVFDNKQGPGGREMRGPVEVIYTSGESADEWIIQQVRKVANARICIVVTDDQAIRRMIRGTGARGMATRDFLKKPASSSRPGPLSGTVDPAIKETITEELKKRWL